MAGAAPRAHTLADAGEVVAAVQSRPDPTWSQVTIPVEGQPVAFEWLAEGRHWVAWADLGDRALTLQARDLPVESGELMQVTDLEPYIHGRRQLDETMARRRDEKR